VLSFDPLFEFIELVMLAQGTQVRGEVHSRQPGEGMFVAEQSARAD
jgi:hypothetical protein